MKYKKIIRQRMKTKRRQLTDHQQKFAAMSIWLQATRQPFFTNSQKIAFYMAIQGELDPLPIIQTSLRLGKKAFLPIVDSSTHKLKFAPYQPNMPMVKNQYGIWEPESTPKDLISIHTLDLVFVPLVAFDKYGNRLGMGKGYYDRAFQNLKDNKKPTRVGLAYHFQKIQAVPTSKQDVKMHAVVTEKKIYSPSKK